MKGRDWHRVGVWARLPTGAALLLAMAACGSADDAPVPPGELGTTADMPLGSPPPLGLQGLVRDIQLHLQELPEVASQYPDDALDGMLRVQYLLLDPLLRFYGPSAQRPEGAEVAAGVLEVEALILSLRSALENPGGPNPERIQAMTEALEMRLDELLDAAEEAGIRPPIEGGW